MVLYNGDIFVIPCNKNFNMITYRIIMRLTEIKTMIDILEIITMHKTLYLSVVIL